MKNIYKVVLGLFIFLLVCSSLHSAQPDFLPVDEGEKNTEFLEFRKKILNALNSNNIMRLKYLVYDKIIAGNTMDAVIGKEDFFGFWDINSSQSERYNEFKIKLKEVLNMGGEFKEGVFVAPYVYSGFKKGIHPSDIVVISKNVNVRKKPTDKSEIIATVSYKKLTSWCDFVRCSKKWQAVRFVDGKIGYVKPKFLKSPLEHRAKFKKIKNEWKLILFQEGE